MSDPIDVEFLEMFASKICHDLISPIGAVNNGIEFLEEMGPDAGKEVTDLIAFSAGLASAKLQAYRIAYGAGGSDPSLKPEDIHKSIEAVVAPDGKIKQEWDPYGDIGHDERPKGFCKLLISAILLGMEGLPKGGTIKVENDGNGNTMVSAEGENAALRETSVSALSLSTPRSALEPQSIHAYTTGLLAKTYGFTISPAQESETHLKITIAQ